MLHKFSTIRPVQDSTSTSPAGQSQSLAVKTIDDRHFEILAYVVLEFAWVILAGVCEFSMEWTQGIVGVIAVVCQAKVNLYWLAPAKKLLSTRRPAL